MKMSRKLKHDIISLKKDDILIVEIPSSPEEQWKIQDLIQKFVNEYKIDIPIVLVPMGIKFKLMGDMQLERMRDEINNILKIRKKR